MKIITLTTDGVKPASLITNASIADAADGSWSVLLDLDGGGMAEFTVDVSEGVKMDALYWGGNTERQELNRQSSALWEQVSNSHLMDIAFGVGSDPREGWALAMRADALAHPDEVEVVACR